MKVKLFSISVHYFHVLSRSGGGVRGGGGGSVAAGAAVVVVVAVAPPAGPAGGVLLLHGGRLLLLLLPEALTYRGEPELVFNQATALIPDTNAPPTQPNPTQPPHHPAATLSSLAARSEAKIRQ